MKIHSWLASSLQRHFPATPIQRRATLNLEGARNEQLSFRVALRLEDSVEPYSSARVEVEAPPELRARVRRVGYVPLRHFNTGIASDELDGIGHIPGFVPDPLFDEDSIRLPQNETHAFWISLVPKSRAAAGEYSVCLRIVPEKGKPRTHIVKVLLHDIVLKKRRDFAVTHWFYIDAIMDWYRTDHFDARFWTLAERYLRNMTSHGLDTLLVPVFTPPLDGIKRPSQLLKVRTTGENRYEFDWSDVHKYIALARKCGFTRFEWVHLFTQWGATQAIRVYEEQGEEEKLLWPTETAATSEIYRAFLSQYLPELQRFLVEEKLLKKSYFHVSDEPKTEHLESYRAAREMLRELAPWMSTLDALSNLEYAPVTDLPVAAIEKALDFVQQNIPSWCYYCCEQRGILLNRVLDTPLPKVAMHGFLFYRWPLQGFLHWGQNYWYQMHSRKLLDPFTVQDGGGWPWWMYGDPFMAYPGEDGPIDSIRWEIFAESLQDYALLQTLGIERSDALFEPIRSFEDFPKMENWRRDARSKLFRRYREQS